MILEWISVRPPSQQNAKENLSSTSLPISSDPGSPLRGNSLTSDSFDVGSAAFATAPVAAQFTEHEVQRGDWLYDIGRRHNVDLRSLLNANPGLIDPDRLPVGCKIRIPQDTSNRRCIPPATAWQPARENSDISKPTSSFTSHMENLTVSKAFVILSQILWKDRVHRVIEGDTLEWLAAKYGTTVSSLRKLNNLHDDIIYAGSLLKIDRAGSYKKDLHYYGKKAGYKERNAEEPIVDTPLPVKVPISGSSLRVRIGNSTHKPRPPSLKTVKVKYGDTLADIAYENGLSIRELQKLNNLRDDAIFEGDVLAVAIGETKSELVDVRPGRRRTTRPLFARHGPSRQNGLPVGGPSLTLKARVATGGIKLEGRWKSKKKGFQQPRDKWLRFTSPLNDGFISSPFGWRWGAFHEGVDLAADQGTPVLASDRGTVTFAGWSGGYGYLVAVQHEGGFVTRYAHCCAIHARVGQQVLRGQQLGYVGSTGRSTGPHLHFEVRKNGEALDPFKWVNL